MRKTIKNGIILLVVTLILISTYWFLIHPNLYYSKDTFGIEQFKNELKAKYYNYEIKDAEKDFLPTTSCGYSNGSKSINVSWVSLPHFYKKGSIIVQYVGENKNIISDLNDILGEQFAGYK